MGRSNDWETPKYIVDIAQSAFGDFGLDAAATRENSVGVKHITEEEDALSIANWETRLPKQINIPKTVTSHVVPTNVWLNPPYKDISKWVSKAIEESDKGLQICILLPNYTETKWFQALESRAEIYTTVGRIQFLYPESKKRTKFHMQYCNPKTRDAPRNGSILAVLRPPVKGLIRPVGVLGGKIQTTGGRKHETGKI